MEEKYLVKKAKRGDAESFGLLYQSVYKKLYKFALYTLNSQQDAEDVVSETIVDAYAGIKNLKNDEAFSSWIFQILSVKCKKKIKDYYRQRNETSLVEEDDELNQEISLESFSVEDERLIEDQVSNKVVIRESFKTLSEDERMIISMHVILGYKTREIAEILQINDNTVRSKESRGLKKMAAFIERGDIQ